MNTTIGSHKADGPEHLRHFMAATRKGREPSLLSLFVKNWGGFEELIANMHKTGSVSVQRDVKLTGVRGVPRQIDVLVTHLEGPYQFRTIIECKYWNSKIKRTHVDAMVTAIQDLNVSKGVFFTTKGYQSGAKKLAKSAGIDIFVVRELTDHEWGGPGRLWDFYVQVISRSIGNLKLNEVFAVQGAGLQAPQISVSIGLGPGEGRTETPAFNAQKAPHECTLEYLLEIGSRKALDQVDIASTTFNNRTDCVVYLKVERVLMPFDPPLQIKFGDVWFACPSIEFDLGIRVDQKRIHGDRAKHWAHAVAIEDCINEVSYAAGKRHADKFATIARMSDAQDQSNQSGDDVVKNGSLIRVFSPELFDFREVSNLVPVVIPGLMSLRPNT
ncbi:restriction endonuclease [Sorangium sp. So ce1153]|uniref:restriction endonuclease n=1 Tax=Sorangium sp. So ce1153 TaxID=3133333 RepID=UPI003F6039BC